MMDEALVTVVKKAMQDATALGMTDYIADKRARAAVSAIEVDHVIITKKQASAAKVVAEWILKP